MLAVGVCVQDDEIGAVELAPAAGGEVRGNVLPGGNGIDAFAEGAVAAVVTRRAPSIPERTPLLVVDDTDAALTALGRAGRARAAARVVAITGSVGKTGTKDMAARALAALAPTFASRGNLNNRIGVPLSLANLDPAAAFCVLELGMSHPGEIAPLSALTRPHVAVITTVAAVHLAHFADVGAIAAAKAEIFAGVGAGGAAVLNRDNAHFAALAAAARAAGIARIIDFGAAPGCMVRLCAYHPVPGRNRIAVEIDGRALTYSLAADGRHWAQNSLAVLAAVHALGADVEAAAAALADFAAPAGRGARREIAVAGGTVTVIDDSYNASPTSMRTAFAMLAETEPAAGGRRVAVLGDMLELGRDAETLHAALALELERAAIDVVHTAGPLMAALHAALPRARRGRHAGDAEALADGLAAALRGGDVVLVKGSRGSAMDKIIAAIAASASGSGRERGTLPRAANGDC